MSSDPADFAIFGSTPAARLLAGLLASKHGRSVIFVGESQSAYRLPRGLDLSVAPVTRPQSWHLLRDGVGETRRLLNRIASRAAWSRLDPIFFADGVNGQEALSHVRQMASAFGMAAEKVPPSLLGKGRAGILLRDAVRLHRPTLEPMLDVWLDRQGVQRLKPQRVEVGMDGDAAIWTDQTDPYRAQQAVLADDAAIMAWLPLRQWPSLLRRQTMSSVLTTPTHPIAAPIMVQADAGITLQQLGDGGIAAWGPGDLSSFSGRLHQLLGDGRRVEQAGQTSFQMLLTRDGAPAVGRVAGKGAHVAMGFGLSGAFLAPALARWLAEASTAAESEWFDARVVGRDPEASSVAEYSPFTGDAAK